MRWWGFLCACENMCSWASTAVLEARGLRLSDSQLLLGAVAGLRSPAPVVALDAIHALAEKAHLSAVATLLRRRL